MADTDTDTRAAQAADQARRDGGEQERCETIEVVIPAHECVSLRRAAVAHETSLSDFIATAATYMALGRLELYDEVDSHADVVALIDAFPEKPPRDSRELCEKFGQLYPETIAVLEDPKTRPIDVQAADHDETVEVHVTPRQLDLLQRATYVADSELRRYVLGTADYVGQLRLGLIETIKVHEDEAEWYGRFCETPADELARLREVVPEAAAASER